MYHDESLFLRQCNLILAHSKPSLVFSRQLQCSHAPTHSTQRSYYLPQRIHISRRCEKVSQLLDDTRFIFALKSTFQKHTPSLSIGTCWRHGRCFLLPWLSWTRQKEEPGKTNSVKIYLLQNTSWWVGPNLATDFSQADVVLVCLCQDVPSQSEKLEMVGPSMKKFNSTDGALK